MTMEQNEIQGLIEESFERGSMLRSLNHYSKDGIEVDLPIEEELLPYTHDTVDLLSPVLYHERNLLYMYIEELIRLFPQVKEEGIMNPKLSYVVETMLLALDFLTHERFIKATFTEEDRQVLNSILQLCFDEQKGQTFSDDANRMSVNKSKIQSNDGKVFALNEREERTRLYMAVFYKKPESLMEHLKHVGKWLGEVNLKPNGAKISYEDYCMGMTDHELHSDTLFYLTSIKNTLAWLMNSSSWRGNDLFLYDEIDLSSKLGIRY